MTWLLFAGAVTLGVLALPYIAAQLLRSLEADQPLSDLAALDGVGAIVVLSGDFIDYAPELGGSTVGPLTLQRLHYATRLHRDSGVPLLLTGGVIGRNRRPLAEYMAHVLDQDFSRPVRWLERSSRSTRENARNTRALLRPLGIDRICLVTHGFHMARARKAFVQQGFDVVAAPTLCVAKPAPLPRDFIPGHTALSRSLIALREWCARGWYAVLAWRDSTRGALFSHVSPVNHFERDVVTSARRPPQPRA
jgi:uncharacterized SAM-binding protein YcdF (DUF218 family)